MGKPLNSSVKPRNLHHPALVGLRCDTGDVNDALGQLNDRKHVVGHQPADGPHFRSKEDRSHDGGECVPRRIGVLLTASLPEGEYPQAFREGLRGAGYIEGRDVVIDWRSANGDYARIPELSDDLVRRKVDLIVVDSTPGAQALKRATSVIPIVIAVVGDPVGSGLVMNLAHPGGNVTGLSMMYADISSKRLQLLKEAIPRLTRVAVLWNPDNPYTRSRSTTSRRQRARF